MRALSPFLNCVVAAGLVFGLSQPVLAQTEAADDLLALLAEPNLPNWEKVEQQIYSEWAKSGSPAADLLLRRGREALEAEEFVLAIEHLTAVIDHTPDFAEAYNMRATAFFHVGQYGPSMSDIQQTLRLNPSHFGAMTGLGAIMEATGDDARALLAFQAASAIHPHDPDLKTAIERLEAKVSGTTL
ncbi:hypothetical protein ACMU_11245 [Actibacterium mucosum KCTC 23349]|uniref:Uncharacterized protein n=1 Tax=Actibacterium mucosum KCTC 23349 TaxID=1454373 RepID=A0A037ZGK3_9RHOB|nr:tetratricopeptide repeat protein [Actibacterium mucosum]KAJ55268.1 hypothetical protein ACMU_11245 [Actibacterium mucosum KCTC 23349]